MIDILPELKPIGDFFKAGRYSDALAELDRLWEKVPSPKEATPNSYLIVSYGATIALTVEFLDEAWIWAQRGLSYSGNFNLAGESEFLAGEVAFARSIMRRRSSISRPSRKCWGGGCLKIKIPNTDV